MIRRAGRGFILGLIFAALILAFSALNRGENPKIQSVINFLCSVPVFIASKFHAYAGDPFIIFTFFIYWGLVGLVFGLISRVEHHSKAFIFIVFLLFLLVVHWLAKVRLEHQIDAAMQAFANIITTYLYQ